MVNFFNVSEKKCPYFWAVTGKCQNLDITEQEAKHYCFLKWMSSLIPMVFLITLKPLIGGVRWYKWIKWGHANAAALCINRASVSIIVKAWVQLDSKSLSDGQQLAVKYFTVRYFVLCANSVWHVAAHIYLPRLSLWNSGFQCQTNDTHQCHDRMDVVWIIGCVYLGFLKNESGTEIVG